MLGGCCHITEQASSRKWSLRGGQGSGQGGPALAAVVEGVLTATFIPIMQLKNEAQKSTQVRQLTVALSLDQCWDIYMDTEQSPKV